MQMNELTEYLVKALVDIPDHVEVRSIDGAETTVIEIRVSGPDLGMVIGRQGQNVESLRQILNSVAAKDRKRVLLDIID